jgi:peptidylprolyl isomerase
VETIKYDVRSQRKLAALDDIKKTKSFLSGKVADKMLASCVSKSVCSDILAEMDATLDPLQSSVKASQDSFTGSEQERASLDKALVEQQRLSKLLTQLEEQMVPPDFVTPVPAEYSDLPQLKKRATVEMVIKKTQDGQQFDVNGVNFPEAKLVMVIDGYTGT